MEVCPLFFLFPDTFFVLQLLQAESPDVCVLPVITEDSFHIPQAPHEILSIRLFRSICERLCKRIPFLAPSSTSRDRFLLVFSLHQHRIHALRQPTEQNFMHWLQSRHQFVSFLSGNRNRFPVCPQREFHPSCPATETGASAFGRCHRVS